MDELQIIQSKIYEIRGERGMLDRDIAALYNVETKVLNQAVKRNIKRFPEDFMFQLSKTEFQIWKSQIVTSNSDKKGLRRPPYAFTEQGVAYLITICDDIKEATGLFSSFWTIFEGFLSIWPKIGRLSIQVEEELKRFLGISSKSL